MTNIPTFHMDDVHPLPTYLYWLSFVDGTCLGVAIVEAQSPQLAVIEAHRLGINPGGEVAIIQIEGKAIEEARELGLNRLISVPELRAHGHLSVRGFEKSQEEPQ